ncbi:uncharacterized protein LOC116190967 isoform X2 [Punica granatum]|uniref:Uncharacterized protein LOC116190967 isoform X2 n=1 Tax=Punica granatum TaxID=22663 RepID=A0A6P8C0K5_PUNGR|nr:uncharacterized protein LOC116190967 isoform X2 [Punica granatum]
MGGGAMRGTVLPTTPTGTPSSSSGLFSPSSSYSSNPFPPNFPASANYSASSQTLGPRPSASCQDPDNGPLGGGARGGGFTFGSFISSVFGPVPSQLEIERAIAALQDFLHVISSSGLERNWVQLLGCCHPRLLLSAGLGRVTHALHLLQTDPSIKRLVVSLSSDRALWEAILNNELVRKLQQSLSTEIRRPRISEEASSEPDSGSDNLWWFLDIVKEKIMELIEKFKSLMDEIFKQHYGRAKQPTAEDTAQLEEKVRSSLLLTVVILLMVVLARVRGA